MTPAEIKAGMRREMLRNIAVSPFVLLVRLPLALVFVPLERLASVVERLCWHLPGWRFDYWRYWRKQQARKAHP